MAGIWKKEGDGAVDRPQNRKRPVFVGRRVRNYSNLTLNNTTPFLVAVGAIQETVLQNNYKTGMAICQEK